MYNTSNNPQVKYSLDNLSHTLFKMLKNECIDKISITELCSKSSISRRTFYRNCDEVIDLVYYKIDSLINGLTALNDENENDDRKNFALLFSYWNNHKNILRVLKKHNFFPTFINRFKLSLANINYHFLTTITSNKPHLKNIKTYFDSFMIGGVSNMLETWADNDFKDSVDELIEISCSLIAKH